MFSMAVCASLGWRFGWWKKNNMGGVKASGPMTNTNLLIKTTPDIIGLSINSRLEIESLFTQLIPSSVARKLPALDLVTATCSIATPIHSMFAV